MGYSNSHDGFWEKVVPVRLSLSFTSGLPEGASLFLRLQCRVMAFPLWGRSAFHVACETTISGRTAATQNENCRDWMRVDRNWRWSRLQGQAHRTLAPQFACQAWMAILSSSPFTLLRGVPAGRGGSVLNDSVAAIGHTQGGISQQR